MVESYGSEVVMALVNGKRKPELDGLTVAEALERLDYEYSRVACELNGEILPRADYDMTILQHGDTLEVVSFVGGG